MQWTYLRSCYGFCLRLFVGGVECVVPARWFWCAEGAQRFPFAHGAEASPWLKNYERNSNWGEITPYPTDPTGLYTRKLDRGRNHGKPGLAYVGQDQWFIDGQLPSDFFGQGVPLPGWLNCCDAPTATGGLVLGGAAIQPAMAQGGLILGGSAQVPSGNCIHCRGGNGPDPMRLTASGGTGDFAGQNGVWSLSFVANCTWESTGFPLPTWGIAFSSPTGWNAGGYYLGAITSYAAPAGWDCYTPIGQWNLRESSGLGTPPTIVVG